MSACFLLFGWRIFIKLHSNRNLIIQIPLKVLYPTNFEQKLGFDQVRENIRLECLSTLGQGYVEKIRFTDDIDLIQKLLEQTHEFKNILVQGLNFPSSNFLDVVPYLSKIKPAGSFLETEELRDIKLSLLTIFSCIDFFESKDEFPVLKELPKGIDIDRTLYKQIDKIISDKGEVKDDASPELREIRRTLLSEQSRIRKELDRILRSIKKEGFAEEEVSVTVRNGRMVIPVAAEHKRKVKGFIHDESSTGQTVFIEPAEVLEINNDIKDLEYKERREVIRLLILVSDLLRENLFQLSKAYRFLGQVDFIRAKARFAIKIEGSKPFIHKNQVFNWKKAKHPLLYLSLKKQDKNIVPLHLRLNTNERILLISGPNAGGKSVTLKTIGLLQYMMQSGLLVSMDDSSEMGIFQNIFIDIGDEQSIENDLSTYSSHLTNMKHFLNFSNRKTIILIDEFGTGTEPILGGAIAESVLEKLNSLKTFGVITTHYANLKTFGDRTEGIVNGAMRFNTEKLEPLYELEIGKPGSSFAFEIARKIGLPEEVLESSKNKIGTTQLDFDKLIAELEVEKTKLKAANARVADKEILLNKTQHDVAQQKDFLEENKKNIINEAKLKAKELFKEANQKIEQTIREIKENKADKDITKIARIELEDFKNTIAPEEDKPKVTPMVVESGEIKAGDVVRVKDSGALGEVIAIKGKDVEISIGELKSTIKLSRLEKISRKAYREALGKENIPMSSGISLSKKLSDFYPVLDIRGKRGEEALGDVVSLLDDALIFGANEIKIVHGKGDGILRTLIRNHLKSYKQVKSMTDEHADRGGAGVTIIRLAN